MSLPRDDEAGARSENEQPRILKDPKVEGPDSAAHASAQPRSGDPAEAEIPVGDSKLTAEVEKLQLEKRVLTRQLSWQSVVLTWLQVGSVPVAIIGIAVSLYLGHQQTNVAISAASNQAKQADENRAADRFDKALGRLADETDVGVRLTGVAGLRLFLTDGNRDHQNNAAHFLLTALANEKSPEVQQAIVDAFRGSGQFTQQNKDEALRTSLELNRTVTATMVEDIHQQRAVAIKTLLTSFFPGKAKKPANDYDFENDLTLLQSMQLRTISAQSLFYDPTDHDSQPPDTFVLDRYVTLINMLVAGGAKDTDNNWTNLYCQNCNFTSAADLSGAHFDGSYLAGADFSHVKLRGATFRNADLNGTIFFASDLTNADLSWDYSETDPKDNAARERGYKAFPLLQCAVLDGANLSRLPLGHLFRSLEVGTSPNAIAVGDSLTMPALNLAKFDKTTRLDDLGVLLTVYIYRHVYMQLSPDRRKRFDDDFFVDNYSWPAGFNFSSLSGIETSTLEGSGHTVGSSEEMAFVKRRILFIKGPRGIDGWVKPLVKVGLDQPIWKSLPTTSALFNQPQVAATSVSAQPVGGDNLPTKCSQPRAPDPRSLMVDYDYFVPREGTPLHPHR